MRSRRTAAVLAVLGAGAALLWWAWGDTPQAVAAPPTAAPPSAPAVVADAPAPAPKARADDRSAARALWKQRLERARRTLDSYREATRYPHESRPLAEHPDQVHPNLPIATERPLREPGGPVIEGLTLRTTQERVYSQGDESVLFTVAAIDGEGRTLPLQVPRAMAHEGATGARPSRVAPMMVQFTDDGRSGDAVAGDNVLSFRLQPARDGFADLDGVIRVELALQSGEHSGYAFFDVIHSPGTPAVWGAVVREAVEAGSLNLYLPAQVMQPGRYVVTGRVDDADGRPLALLSFNDELGVGPVEFKLQLFGKLVRDMQPTFPLVLRDVDAFLLKPDTFPDRALMPRRIGQVHRTKAYPLVAFSPAEWTSEERNRYLTEYGKDVQEAEDHLKDLGSGP
ncbi:MAG TPA: hypothetical protein VFY73_16335 [Ideonella sp.]|uniref:hypothetical protein n=1 Tax=Ideonella sp. TaxID=1929293 RepID=UPI002E3340FD|nr:hypothetical protein [Ideonella sp.]HEX5685590.1 hypothetical protein [Ideonella sp.]